jgi:hypothetical protein
MLPRADDNRQVNVFKKRMHKKKRKEKDEGRKEKKRSKK